MAGRFRSSPPLVRHRGARVAFIAVSVALLSYVVLVHPQSSPLPHCTFHSLTGHSCPTCGMTRSLHALAHGDLQAALEHHPLGPGLGLLLVAFNVLLISEILMGRRLELNAGRLTRRGFLCVAVGLGFCLWMGAWAIRLDREVGAVRSCEDVARQSVIDSR
jgi:hypothetical protein